MSAVQPAETAALVLKYLVSSSFNRTAGTFRREASKLLKSIEAPTGVKSLTNILTEYVTLKDLSIKRQHLLQSHPLAADMAAVLDRYAQSPAQLQQPAVAAPVYSQTKQQQQVHRVQTQQQQMHQQQACNLAGPSAPQQQQHVAHTADMQLDMGAGDHCEGAAEWPSESYPTASCPVQQADVQAGPACPSQQQMHAVPGHSTHHRKGAPQRKRLRSDSLQSPVKLSCTSSGGPVPTGLDLDWLDMPITEDGLSCLLSNDDFQIKFAEGLASHLTSGAEADKSNGPPFESLLATLPTDPAMVSLLEPLVMPFSNTQPCHHDSGAIPGPDAGAPLCDKPGSQQLPREADPVQSEHPISLLTCQETSSAQPECCDSRAAPQSEFAQPLWPDAGAEQLPECSAAVQPEQPRAVLSQRQIINGTQPAQHNSSVEPQCGFEQPLLAEARAQQQPEGSASMPLDDFNFAPLDNEGMSMASSVPADSEQAQSQWLKAADSQHLPQVSAAVQDEHLGLTQADHQDTIPTLHPHQEQQQWCTAGDQQLSASSHAAHNDKQQSLFLPVSGTQPSCNEAVRPGYGQDIAAVPAGTLEQPQQQQQHQEANTQHSQEQVQPQLSTLQQQFDAAQQTQTSEQHPQSQHGCATDMHEQQAQEVHQTSLPSQPCLNGRGQGQKQAVLSGEAVPSGDQYTVHHAATQTLKQCSQLPYQPPVSKHPVQQQPAQKQPVQQQFVHQQPVLQQPVQQQPVHQKPVQPRRQQRMQQPPGHQQTMQQQPVNQQPVQQQSVQHHQPSAAAPVNKSKTAQQHQATRHRLQQQHAPRVADTCDVLEAPPSQLQFEQADLLESLNQLQSKSGLQAASANMHKDQVPPLDAHAAMLDSMLAIIFPGGQR